VVLNTGGPVLMPWLSQVKGVLEMWFPGQEGATATADLLTGRADPSGKLPITFPADSASTPFAGHPERVTGVNGQIVWSEGLEMGYRWYLANHVHPLFPFGYGLSYSSFAYDGLKVSGPHGGHGAIAVSFRVRNTGEVTATEVPQLYLTLPAAAAEPSQRLAGFDRVTLKPGQSRIVHLVIDPASTQRPLSYWDSATQQWRTPGGRFGVLVGASVTDIRLAGGFMLS
jgi:beta-glucosidase